MLSFKTDDIFSSGCDILVHPVNCKGKLNAGIGYHYKNRFPHMWAEYQMACRMGMVRPKRIHWYQTRSGNPKFIASLPVKDHPNKPARLDHIIAALKDLLAFTQQQPVASIAMPQIGCGLGGPTFKEILPHVYSIFGESFDLEVTVFHMENQK
jgi:O-acetyl-ADP-ribose deacetylase (regulator of RNase III)